MRNDQVITVSNNVANDGGYKVIKVNLSNVEENLYAVCTPIKMQ